MENPTDTSRKQFTADLQKGLRKLYDPVELRKSPLIYWLNIETQNDIAVTLRRAIVDAIQALKPDARIPAEAQARRIFEVLTYRFIEQTGQKEVANDLALSIRQLRRLEIQAVHTLAEQLLVRHPENRCAPKTAPPVAPAPVSIPAGPPEINSSVHAEAHELALLRTSMDKEKIQAVELVENVIRISEPLAARWNVRIVLEALAPSTPVFVHLVTMRQALLSIMTVAMQLAGGGTLTISLREQDHFIVISFLPVSAVEQAVAEDEVKRNAEAIHMAAELAGLSQGKIQLGPAGRPWQAEVILSRLEPIPVFVIDDNTDALRLIERYLEGSPFRCLSAHEPARALALAEELDPRMILLDVMLPGIDGWELLGRIREHPRLGRVPVIITTILPQETLALTLGAAGFLRKPFTREDLLRALEQQLGSREKE